MFHVSRFTKNRGFTPLEVVVPRGNHKKNKPLTGFTVVELIITIAVLSIGIIGIYSAFTPFIALNSNASSKFLATYLGQEGLEIIRNLRDNNFISEVSWSSGLLSCVNGCQADYKTGTSVETDDNKLKPYNDNNFLKLNSDGFYSYDIGTSTPYKRKIIITQPLGTDTMKVEVIVFWSYNETPYTYEAESYLYNWY